MAGNTGNRKTTQTRKRTNSSSKNTKKKRFTNEELLMINYGVIISSVFVCILLFLCNFGKVGAFGNVVSIIMFSVFGWMAYLLPIFLLIISFLWIAKRANESLKLKIIAFIVLFFSVGIIIEMFSGATKSLDTYNIKAFIESGYEDHVGGGLISGSIGYGMNKLFDTPFTVVINVLLVLASFFVLFGSTIISFWVNNRENISDAANEVNEYRREHILKKKESVEDTNSDDSEKNSRLNRKAKKNTIREEVKNKIAQEEEEEETKSILRMDKKVKGVSFDHDLGNSVKAVKKDDMHEITIDDIPEVKKETIHVKDSSPYDKEIKFHTADYESKTDELVEAAPVKTVKETVREPEHVETRKPEAHISHEEIKPENKAVKEEVKVNVNKKYKFPPLSLLSKNENSSSSSIESLSQTAHKLEDALDSFGVSARVTDVSQGPSVTRYELEPAVGV